AQTLKNAPDNFCAAAWLCTRVNGGRFREGNTVKAPKETLNCTAAHERDQMKSVYCRTSSRKAR
ncbi:TPA: hypothetical protein ACLGZN_004687, partial [Salmonella enterica]